MEMIQLAYFFRSYDASLLFCSSYERLICKNVALSMPDLVPVQNDCSRNVYMAAMKHIRPSR